VRGCGTVAATAPTGVPHSPQNFDSASSGEPQAAQASVNIVPHSLQNFLPGEFSLPQAPQVIGRAYAAESARSTR
jgi:hypothetical protein